MSFRRIALIQLVSSQHVEKNLPRVQSLIDEALADGAQSIFLPENFAALAHPNPHEIGLAESTREGPIRRFLSDTARSNSCWIFAGTCPVATSPSGEPVADNRVRAASLVIDPKGEEVARYDKIHMFDADVADNQKSYRESDTFEAGSDVVAVDTPMGRFGLTVCYDLRFPELYRELFLRDVDFVTAPSAFTTITGEEHFKLLMRARAVENCCFTIAACQGGSHDSGRETWGHSMVCNPWGEVVGELDTGEGILVVDIDLSIQAQLRKDMPFRRQLRLLEDPNRPRTRPLEI